jgi:hypothetical protein
VRQVRKSRPDTVVPIVIHFDEHGKIMQTAFWLSMMRWKGLASHFDSMLQLIGSAATTNGSDLHNLHKAGHYFIVPITTGSSAKFSRVKSYCVTQVGD